MYMGVWEWGCVCYSQKRGRRRGDKDADQRGRAKGCYVIKKKVLTPMYGYRCQ